MNIQNIFNHKQMINISFKIYIVIKKINIFYKVKEKIIQI